jgi:hypothetical protein
MTEAAVRSISLMPSEVLAVVGTLAGALIGSLSTLTITWINKRSEERKYYRGLMMNAAIEHYKQQTEVVLKNGGLLRPLDDYLLHMSKVAQIISKRNVTPDDLDRIYGEAEALQVKLDERRQKLRTGELP